MHLFLRILAASALTVLVTADLHHYHLIPWELPHPKVDLSTIAVPWEEFFSVFGMIYAIFGGFLLIRVLERYSSLSRTLEAEINAIQNARDYLFYFYSGQTARRLKIASNLLDYLVSIRVSEWKLMRLSNPNVSHMSSDTSTELREVMTAMRDLDASSAKEEIALSGLLDQITAVASCRTQRVGLASERLPFQLRLLLAILSLALLAGFSIMPFGSPSIHLAMVAILTVATYLIYNTIEDLNCPFSGLWNLSQKPLTDAEAELREQLAQLQSMNRSSQPAELAP